MTARRFFTVLALLVVLATAPRRSRWRTTRSRRSSAGSRTTGAT